MANQYFQFISFNLFASDYEVITKYWICDKAGASEAMQKVKIMLKQQADQAHYAALMEGIQKNCLTACDNDSKSALGKM